METASNHDVHGYLRVKIFEVLTPGTKSEDLETRLAGPARNTAEQFRDFLLVGKLGHGLPQHTFELLALLLELGQVGGKASLFLPLVFRGLYLSFEVVDPNGPR